VFINGFIKPSSRPDPRWAALARAGEPAQADPP